MESTIPVGQYAADALQYASSSDGTPAPADLTDPEYGPHLPPAADALVSFVP